MRLVILPWTVPGGGLMFTRWATEAIRVNVTPPIVLYKHHQIL